MTALEKRRARIRGAVPVHLAEMRDLVRAAEDRLPAPDPESGLVYLWQLHEVLEEVLGELDRYGAARRIGRRTA
jgi:hypothetical protein